MKIQEDATCIFDVNCGAGSSLMYTSQICIFFIFVLPMSKFEFT
jgi:hypothetical protein